MNLKGALLATLLILLISINISAQVVVSDVMIGTPEVLCPTECDDLDPCTNDYCLQGECVFEQEPEKTECGDKMECIEGECVEEKKLSTVVITRETGAKPTAAAILVVLLVLSMIILVIQINDKELLLSFGRRLLGKK